MPASHVGQQKGETMNYAFPSATLYSAALSRRAMLRSGLGLGAGAALASLPFPLLAQSGAGWPNVDAMLSNYVGGGKVANMVAALGRGAREAQFLAQGRRGFSLPERAGADSLYRIYSMTKPITGMAAMICIDEGLFGLDQPLAEILPGFANLQVQKRYDGAITPDNLEPAARPITIRQLLTHTAGLGYSLVQNGPIAQAYIRYGIVPGQVTRLPLPAAFAGTPASSLAKFADNLARMPLVFQPGTRWSYSVGLDLMGRVIEVVSGMAFDAFLKQRIFDPVGMDSTWFQVPAGEADRLTANYFSLLGALVPIDMPDSSIYLDKPAFPFGGAGLVSSARDYDRFLQMVLGYGQIDGRRVMSEAAVRLGTSNLLPTTLHPNDPVAAQYGFGAGGRVGTRGAEIGSYGWGGAAGTLGFVHFGTGTRATLMTQYMPSDIYALEQQFPAAVLADLDRQGDA